MVFCYLAVLRRQGHDRLGRSRMQPGVRGLLPHPATPCGLGVRNHSLSPHRHPTSRRLRRGDVVGLNVFPVILGDCMELEQTYVYGEPTKDQATALRACCWIPPLEWAGLVVCPDSRGLQGSLHRSQGRFTSDAAPLVRHQQACSCVSARSVVGRDPHDRRISTGVRNAPTAGRRWGAIPPRSR